MSILLATLVLNEMEWLPKLYEQHKDWPELVSWVFVESADRVFALANPELVTEQGLSTDGTSEFLRELAANDLSVTYLPFGFSSSENLANGKAEARQAYLDCAEEIKPDFVFVLDSDEFHTKAAQARITYQLKRAHSTYTGFVFRQQHIWHPASVQDFPLFSYEVQGGYWAVPHTRGWRWRPGIRYCSSHNYPELGTKSLNKSLARYDNPTCCHMGFAGDPKYRIAKNRYYVARGEGPGDGRQMYVDCRAAFETWQPGQALPHKARVVPFTGEIPECFREAD